MAGIGGPATSTSLSYPTGLAISPFSGVLFITNFGVSTVISVSLDGLTTTLYAGTGLAGFSGDGGPASLAKLNRPAHCSAAKNGDLFIAEQVCVWVKGACECIPPCMRVLTPQRRRVHAE